MKNYLPTILGITAGEILATEFLEPLKITPYRLAKETGIPLSRISDIIKGKRSITAETALTFSLYFNNSPEFWLNIQTHFDLEKAALNGFEQIGAE